MIVTEATLHAMLEAEYGPGLTPDEMRQRAHDNYEQLMQFLERGANALLVEPECAENLRVTLDQVALAASAPLTSGPGTGHCDPAQSLQDQGAACH